MRNSFAQFGQNCLAPRHKLGVINWLFVCTMATVTVQFDIHFNKAAANFENECRMFSGTSNVDPIPITSIARYGPHSSPTMFLGFSVASSATTRQNLNTAAGCSCSGWLELARGIEKHLYVVNFCSVENVAGSIICNLICTNVNNNHSSIF